MSQGIIFPSPGGLDHGPAPRPLIAALESVGAQLEQHATADTYREAQTITSIAGWREDHKYTVPSEDDEKTRKLIAELLAFNPEISRLQVQRYIRGADGIVRSWHTDLATGAPSRRLDGSWIAPTTFIGDKIFSLAIHGPSMLVACGKIVEDEPVTELADIHIPADLEVASSRTAHLMAGALLEETLTATPQTIIGHTVDEKHERVPYLVRWRQGQVALQGAVAIQTVPEGHILQTHKTSVHVPPEALPKDRTVLIAATENRTRSLASPQKNRGVLWHLMHHNKRSM